MVAAARHGADRDPGLQPERTGLAWSRTALSLFGIGLLCLRAAVVAESRLSLAASVVAIATSVAVIVRARARPGYDAVGEDVATGEAAWLGRAITGAVVVVALLEIAAVAARRLMLSA
jgi:uncharacterized membrane protein YidH (DUF202 family)